MSAQNRAQQAARLRNITLRSAVAPRTIVLGTARTSGPMMYAEFVGTNDDYLDTIVAVNHGEAGELVGVYIGDEYIPAASVVATFPTTGKYAVANLHPDNVEVQIAVVASNTATLPDTPFGAAVLYVLMIVGSGDSQEVTALTVTSVVGAVVTWSGDPVTATVTIGYYSLAQTRSPLRVQWAMGSPTQATTTWGDIATPRWTADHRLRGVTYVRTLKLIDDPLFESGGGQDVGAVIRGPKGVWDPRTSTTVNHTSNPALLAAWFRTLPVADGGMGVPSGWIDWPSVSAAANICDELISVRQLDGTGYEDVKRYECNTRLSLDRVPLDNLQIILGCMAGDFPFTAGLYRCFAGAFRSAALTLTDDDVVGTENITFAPQAGARVSPPNVVTARFYDAARNWVEQQAPAVVNSSYVTLDGADEPLELDLEGTVDARQANYLMGVRLEQARPALAGTLTVTGKGANLALMDTVQISLQGYSAIAGKTFEVRRRTNQWTGQYPLELREIKASSFALDADRFTAAPAAAPPVNNLLFNVSAVPLTGATEQLVRQVDGSIISRLELVWTAHPQAYVRDRGTIRLRWRPVGGDWAYAAPVPGDSLRAYTGPLQDNQLITAEVQAINGAGAEGPWATAALVRVLGKSAAPGNPASVTATQVPGGVVVKWAPNTEVDYLDTEIRSGASWAAGTLLWRGTADRHLLPWPAAGALTLWVAHRDTSQNYSAAPVSVSLTVDGGVLIGTGSIAASAVTDVTVVTASNVGITGVSGTGPNGYNVTLKWTPIATIAFTASFTGDASVHLTLRIDFSGAGSIAVDELWCQTRINIDFDGDLVADADERVIEDFLRARQTGTDVCRTAVLPAQFSRAITNGVNYSWPVYGQGLEGTQTVVEFHARVEQIKR